jgi:putative hemolysin
MSAVPKIIDIRKAFRNSDSGFFRSLPGFAIRLVERLIRQDDMNATINRSRNKTGVPFINDVLKGWNVKVDIRGGSNIPAGGRFIFASNHPVGGMDALAFYSMVYSYFPEVKSPTNELLGQIPNLRPVMLGINVFGRNSREIVSEIEELFRSDTQILIFPSGEVSRRKNGVIADPVWQKTFVTKAIQYKRDIIPVHIGGRNSNLFYFVASLRKRLGIKMFIESAMLPREMMNQRNSTVTLTIGKAIPWHSLTTGLSQTTWAQHIREIVYDLPVKKQNLYSGCY